MLSCLYKKYVDCHHSNLVDFLKFTTEDWEHVRRCLECTIGLQLQQLNFMEGHIAFTIRTEYLDF